MSNVQPGEYLESGYKPSTDFIDEQCYAKALDTIVVACVDIVVISQGKVLLGKRTWHPQADWWVAGGRMRTGETFKDSAKRLLEKELGISVISDRFTFLTVFTAAWRKRAHPPENNGTHTLSVVMKIELNEAENQYAVSEEYSEVKWLTPQEIKSDERFHPALHQIASALVVYQ